MHYIIRNCIYNKASNKVYIIFNDSFICVKLDFFFLSLEVYLIEMRFLLVTLLSALFGLVFVCGKIDFYIPVWICNIYLK
jgi:hypothetical protein